MDRDEVIYLYMIYVIGPNAGISNSCIKIAVFFTDGLVCCYRFTVIRGTTGLSHKHFKVPRSHFNPALATQQPSKDTQNNKQRVICWRTSELEFHRLEFTYGSQMQVMR